MRQNERDIRFNVDAYTAKLIGRENVSKLEGAVLEVVKNAYDADAKVCCLYYSQAQECLYIIDNGVGMDEETLRKHWMTIGNSSKKDTYKSKNERIQTGAKGIGRFALDRMSDRCEMLTISDNGGLEWIVNWADFDGNKNLSDVKAKLYDADESILEYARISQWKNTALANEIMHLELNETGTVFRLYGLHDDWDEKTRNKLRNHLENLLPPDVVDDFVIYFFDDETEAENAKIVSANIDSFDYKISFNVTIEKVSISILRNEFDFGTDEKDILEKAGIDCSDIPYFHGTPIEEQFTFEELGETKNYIGNFDGILYFNKITATEKDTATFYYKDIKGRRNLTKEFGGIKLYRDHFRVRPYGEYGDNDFDWLELSARRNRSPSAISHKTGKWRAGSEQMVGQVNISRENTNLEDAANRNGIQEGPGFEQLKRILLFIIAEFERDRQSIGRKLAEYKKQQDKLQEELDRLRELAEARRRWEQEQRGKNEESASTPEPTVNPQEAQSVIESLTEQKEQEIQELRDENRMLQTLATTGIVTNMFMHEIRTLTNNIGLELDSAYDSLKYDKNIEEAFESVKQAIVLKKHFASWFRVTIESVRKDKRKRSVCNIKDMLGDYINTWQLILEKDDVVLSMDCENDILFKCFPFDVENVISNLISNSLASFERETNDILEKKEIYISISGKEDGFVLSYEDTGWGLMPKYKNRPDLITEAFESERGDQNEEGTGMGMWIVKKTALEYDGDIDLSENIGLEIGFKAKISFGGKYV
jgi:signal transduction histidine kinase